MLLCLNLNHRIVKTEVKIGIVLVVEPLLLLGVKVWAMTQLS